MSMCMKVILILISTTAIFSSSSTATPWPQQWETTFSEHLSNTLSSGDTTGFWAYDYLNGRFYVERENGKLDRYCGTIFKFVNTKCIQVVMEGVRFIYFPEKNFCCTCCTSEQGCGVVKSDWVLPGIPLGASVSQGVNTWKFNVKGNQNNIYEESQVTGQPIRLSQEPLSDMLFEIQNYKKFIKDTSIFKIPSQYGSCEKSCGFGSVCEMIPKQ